MRLSCDSFIFSFTFGSVLNLFPLSHFTCFFIIHITVFQDHFGIQNVVIL
jgi:hypothetical protein